MDETRFKSPREDAYERILSEARKLSIAERMLLMDEIWASIDAEQPNPPFTANEQRELDRRLADYEATPHAGDAWPAVRKRIGLSQD
jgi:putative addiction module component (TIGR02574 family)